MPETEGRKSLRVSVSEGVGFWCRKILEGIKLKKCDLELGLKDDEETNNDEGECREGDERETQNPGLRLCVIAIEL